MEVYHGSYTVVRHPRVLKGRYTKDFGEGFYCTMLEAQAERWAGKFDTPVLNMDVARANGSHIIDTAMAVYNSWITRKIDNYNSSMYYESPSYLFESYKAGTVLA